jgi:hypothetical protein
MDITVYISKICSKDIKCNIDMGMQHEQSTGNAARTCGMAIKHGHEVCTLFMGMHHGHTARTCTKDMLKGFAAWTCHAGWTDCVNIH